MRWACVALGVLLVACGGGGGSRSGALPAPTGVVAASGVGENRVDWTVVPGATGYEVYWDTSPGVTKATGTPVSVASPPFQHTGLTVGLAYHYVVTAVRKEKESDESVEVSATPIAPPPPGGVTATPGDGQVRIDWIPVPGATSYNLYFDTAPGVTDATGSLLPAVTPPHDHTGLTNGVTYYYVLTALVGPSEGSISLEVSATPLPMPGGSLDAAFGGQGWILHDGAAGGGTEDVAYGVSMDSAGRILVTGWSMNTGVHEVMATWRLNGDGSLDTTFNSRGWVTYDGGGTILSFDEGFAVLEDSAGRIVVAGTVGVSNSDQDMAVWRYDPTGSPDPTFGTAGLVLHDGAASGAPLGREDWAYAMMIHSGGDIIVAGGSHNGADWDAVLLAFDDAGGLDPAFGAGGIVIDHGAAGGNSWDEAFQLVEDPSRRILVAGYSTDPSGASDMVLWRFDPSGTPDPTFGGGSGFVTDDGTAGGSDEYGEGIALDPSGDILVSGIGDNPAGNYDMIIWRYDSSGNPVPTFGSGGAVVHHNAAGGNGWDDGLSIVLDGHGRAFVAGFSIAPGTDRDMVVWGYDGSGTLDPLFATSGMFTYDAAVPGGNATGHAITIDAQDRLVVAGSTEAPAGPPDMAVWRIR